LDNLQAAILNHRLNSYDQAIVRRRAIATMYDERLKHVPGLQLPPPPGSDPLRFDIFQNYELQAERRDELRNHLKACGVGTLVQWGGKAVHQFRGLGFNQKLPYVEIMFQRALMLPLNTALSDDDVNYVCDCVSNFYAMTATKARVAA
jgi:dTDP-4-amino-4,6-dideoxygalactose transaminase